MKAFETKLGYTFADPTLLEQALTHRSLKAVHNERLEFLGDAVLGLVIANLLYLRDQDASEGALSQTRSGLVSRAQLASVANMLDVPTYMQVGPGERRSEGIRLSILSDALEALIGAVFLDGGLDAATDCITRWFASMLSQPFAQSNKCQLQQFAQSCGAALPTYQLLHQEGRAHQMHFFVECQLAGFDVLGKGEGVTKQEAEQMAAKQVLAYLKEQGHLS